ncbi:MAG TPA: hypothetical protein VNI01_02670 [Elusimicrobiota bacterium]|jgi:hypothetical protein|nr:hypothetical protein [Elusimicrobiota bacterium]
MRYLSFLALAIASSGCMSLVQNAACSQSQGISYTDESGAARCILPGETAQVTNYNKPRKAVQPPGPPSGPVTTCQTIGAGEERCFTK